MSFGIWQIHVLKVEIMLGQIPTKLSLFCKEIKLKNGLVEVVIKTTYSETALEVQNSYILLGNYRVPYGKIVSSNCGRPIAGVLLQKNFFLAVC